MKSLIYEFWTDQSGVIVSAEIVIVATVLVLGLIVGLNAVQSAIVFELNDISRAFCSLNQSYWFSGFRGCKARVPGSAFTDINTCARVCFLTEDLVWSGVSQGGFIGTDFGVGAPAVSVAPPTVAAPVAPAPVVAPAPTIPCPTPCPPTSLCPPVSTPPTAICPPTVPSASTIQTPSDTCQPMSVIMPPGYKAPLTTPPVLMIR